MTVDSEVVLPDAAVIAWVDEIARLTQPERIYWCDGSEEEKKDLLAWAVNSGELEPLNAEFHPESYLHRSHPRDTARTEDRTFICSPAAEEAGPNNLWMDPAQAYQLLRASVSGALKGKALYVVPFLMGHPQSPLCRAGVQVTDSLYVALSLRVLTRMGAIAWKLIREKKAFTRCVHVAGDLDPARKYVCHFPQDNAVWSVHSAYGGNALLNKKCLALRLASVWGYREGWLAEHMFLTGIETPQGEIYYFAGAFPSGCGKTNLSMLLPPGEFKDYKVWTLGDDIAWLYPGEDGRLWAINPEMGFFGIAPGTSRKTNSRMMDTLARDVIFTNTAKTLDGKTWWEGKEAPPAHALDWQGKDWTPDSGSLAAQPNARYAVSIKQCPSLSPEWDNPKGVPLSGLIFGSRHAGLYPLVFQAFNWQHGVFSAVNMLSESTSAVEGASGRLRRDPMAMKPFCGYNMAAYFSHWLNLERRLKYPPPIFHVNWFRKDERNQYLWPGFQENFRVLEWMIRRIRGEAKGRKMFLGMVPGTDELNLQGLNFSPLQAEALSHTHPSLWRAEAGDLEQFFTEYGAKLPDILRNELNNLKQRIEEADE